MRGILTPWTREHLRTLALAAASFVAAFLTAYGIRAASADNPSPPPPLPDDVRAQLVSAGPVWTGKGGQGVSQQEIEAFDRYPLFWLGTEYAGFNLRAIIPVRYDAPPGVPAFYGNDSVSFVYGDCESADEQGCELPLSVIVQPICEARPDEIAEHVKAGPLETVRGGALLQRFQDGHVQLYAGSVTITVHMFGNPKLVDQAVQDLHGIGKNQTAARMALAAPALQACGPLPAEILSDAELQEKIQEGIAP